MWYNVKIQKKRDLNKASRNTIFIENKMHTPVKKESISSFLLGQVILSVARFIENNSN
jgi:hypothetical protein